MLSTWKIIIIISHYFLFFILILQTIIYKHKIHNICSFVYILFLSFAMCVCFSLSLSLTVCCWMLCSMMNKDPTSRKRFGRQFKHRYFRLTTHSLSYAKSKGKQPICDIPLEEIGSVEQLKDKASRSKTASR